MGYTLIFFLILMLIINFTVLRPHKRAFNKRAVMLNSVRVGAVVYTEDGVRAKVDAVNRDVLKISCYPDGVKLLVELESVNSIENYDEKRAEYLMNEKVQKGRESLKRKKLEKEKEEAKKRLEKKRKKQAEKEAKKEAQKKQQKVV